MPRSGSLSRSAGDGGAANAAIGSTTRSASGSCGSGGGARPGRASATRTASRDVDRASSAGTPALVARPAAPRRARRRAPSRDRPAVGERPRPAASAHRPRRLQHAAPERRSSRAATGYAGAGQQPGPQQPRAWPGRTARWRGGRGRRRPPPPRPASTAAPRSGAARPPARVVQPDAGPGTDRRAVAQHEAGRRPAWPAGRAGRAPAAPAAEAGRGRHGGAAVPDSDAGGQAAGTSVDRLDRQRQPVQDVEGPCRGDQLAKAGDGVIGPRPPTAAATVATARRRPRDARR